MKHLSLLLSVLSVPVLGAPVLAQSEDKDDWTIKASHI